MKKILAVMICMCMCGAALFAQEEKTEGVAFSPEMKAIQTAYSLAEYGYENESASALLEAAEILAQISKTALGATATQGESSTPSATKKTSRSAYTPESLLADGRKFAGKNKTMTNWASEIEKALKQKTRGAVGGWRNQVDIVQANSTVEYQLAFRANEIAEIYVAGDGDSDLDLFIYDANGNLIVSDTRYAGDCGVAWTPRWTGNFVIVVKNQGRVWNQVEIITN